MLGRHLHKLLPLNLSTIIVRKVREERISSMAMQVVILSLELLVDFVGAIAFNHGKHEHDPKYKLCEV